MNEKKKGIRLNGMERTEILGDTERRCAHCGVAVFVKFGHVGGHFIESFNRLVKSGGVGDNDFFTRCPLVFLLILVEERLRFGCGMKSLHTSR